MNDVMTKFIDENGIEYDTLPEYLQIGVLDFCACGRPGNNLNYIRKGLAILRDFYNSESINYEEFKRLVDELYHDSDNAYFFWYWCDKEGYTEHGSGLPGWLTEEGEQLLAQLEEWYATVDIKKEL